MPEISSMVVRPPEACLATHSRRCSSQEGLVGALVGCSISSQNPLLLLHTEQSSLPHLITMIITIIIIILILIIVVVIVIVIITC